jgi:hypothetical protein
MPFPKKHPPTNTKERKSSASFLKIMAKILRMQILPMRILIDKTLRVSELKTDKLNRNKVKRKLSFQMQLVLKNR